MQDAVAIVPAAGLGQRMGADKALLTVGGTTLIERVVATCRGAGVAEVLVVRRTGADPLPDLAAPGAAVRILEVPPGGEMADSLRAAQAALPASCRRVVVLPVDHALVAADTVLAVLARLLAAADGESSDRGDHGDGPGIALPIHQDRPGHPVAMQRAVFDEITAPGAVLRDLVRRDPARVAGVETSNPWVRADLDRPEDLRAARTASASAGSLPAVEQMFRHRSRRAFRPDPIPPDQLERLADAARHASTSSYIQTATLIAVTDPQRKAECARLCGNQQQILDAPVFFAVCADLHRIATACERFDTTLSAGSFELFLQATVDAALVGQNLQLAAESEGLGACMIGAARNHPVQLAELLGLPPTVYVVFGMTLGVPMDDPAPRGRMPLAGVLHRETYDRAGVPAALDGADGVMRDWAKRANAENGGYAGRLVDEAKGWAQRMARAWGADSRYVAARRALVADLRRLGFGLELPDEDDGGRPA
ncbi:MAG: NTP transferase domain-containing protein [bacterium]|nr:NTP transferase domain-containing protein [bacterium]